MTNLLAAPPGPRLRPRSRPGGLAVIAGALALSLLLVACGSGGAGDDGVVSLVDPSASAASSAPPSASIDPEEAMLAFTDCMREHGVDIQVSIATEGGGEVGVGPGVTIDGTTGTKDGPGDPQTGPQDPKAMEKADEACKHLLPAGGMGDPSRTMDPALQDQMLAFAKCMRDNGINYPDPDFSGGGMSIQIGGEDGGGIDPGSDAFQDAQAACAKDLPDGGGLSVPAPVVKP